MLAPNFRKSSATRGERRRSRPGIDALEARNLLSTVYFNDFSSGDTSGWCLKAPLVFDGSKPTPPVISQGISTVPGPSTRGNFLGEFSNGTATLTVPNVPAGPVTVSTDVYILRTWDGNEISHPDDKVLGDNFAMQIDGNTVLNTNFSLTPLVGNTQQYPGAPGATNSAFTGSVEHGTLGTPGLPGPESGSAVYRLTFTVNHATAGNLVVQYSASQLQNFSANYNPDETWGLDNVWVATDANQTKTIGWYQNKNGQAQIQGVGVDGQNQSLLWDYLTAEYPNLFGANGAIIKTSNVHPGSGPVTSGDIASYYKNVLFKNSSLNIKAEAQVATAAFSVYFYGPTQFSGTSGYGDILTPPFNTTLGNTYGTNDILTMLDATVGIIPGLITNSTTRPRVSSLFDAINMSHDS